MSPLSNVLSLKCPLSQMSALSNVLSLKCPLSQISALSNVRLANVRLANIPLSNVRLANIQLSNVRVPFNLIIHIILFIPEVLEGFHFNYESTINLDGDDFLTTFI